MLSVLTGVHSIFNWLGVTTADKNQREAEELATKEAKRAVSHCVKAFKSTHGLLTY